jgi:ribonuclease T2
MKLLLILALVLACPAFPQKPAKPGEFDYYLLVLSWSPEFCHGKPSAAQCREHRNFVLHGLWPQNNDGSYPANCRTTQPVPADLSKIKQIMPSEIVAHEWQKHGTCSGLSGDEYFRLAQTLFESVKIPAALVAPTRTLTTRPTEFKKNFENANPDLADEDIAIQLRARYLNAVELCFSKADHPAPTPCLHISDVKGGTFRIPPVK